MDVGSDEDEGNTLLSKLLGVGVRALNMNYACAETYLLVIMITIETPHGSTALT